MINISVVRIGEMIKMTIEEVLRSKSLWIASVLPYGCPGADIARSEISTYKGISTNVMMKPIIVLYTVTACSACMGIDRSINNMVQSSWKGVHVMGIVIS